MNGPDLAIADSQAAKSSMFDWFIDGAGGMEDLIQTAVMIIAMNNGPSTYLVPFPPVIPISASLLFAKKTAILYRKKNK